MANIVESGDPAAAKLTLRRSAIIALLPTLVLVLAASLRLLALADVPPGLYYDESANGVDALRVLAGEHPVFFVGDQGREPLTIYLQALSMAAIGPSPLALRLPSAFLGILTVAATYATFRAFAGRSVGLIGAGLLAVSFWHVSLSRLAFRAVALPLFTTLAVFWFWKGIKSGRLRHFSLAGALLGVDLYTYIPSRLAPVLFAIWLVGCALIPAWRKPTSARGVLLGGLIAGATFAVVVLPLARYFYLNPSDFAERLQNVAAPSVRGPLAGAERAVEALVAIGDPNPRQDLPGRPLLDLPVSVAAIVGVAFGASAWRRDGTALFALLWCAAMLVPAALTDEPAHALRLVGVLPFVLLFPARALDATRRARWPAVRRVGLVAAALIVVGGGLATARDYFLIWPSRVETIDAFQSDLLQSLALVSRAPVGATTFATADVYEGQPIPLSFVPTVASRARAYDGRDAFVIPASPTSPVYYASAASFRPPGGLASVASLATMATSRDASGRVDGNLFRLDPPFSLRRADRPVDVSIGSAVRVTGVDVVPLLQPGQATHVALHWIVRGQLGPGDWQFFAHLVGRDQQQLVAEDYNYGFAPSQWRTGDQVISWFTLPVPADAPAGVADVSLGLFDRATGRRLDLTTPSGQPAGNALLVGPLRIDRPRPTAPPQRALVAHFGPSIALLGYDLDRRSNGDVALTLHWRADGPIDRDYTVFVHVLDSAGKVAVGADSQPGAGAWPTSTWGAGESFADEHILPGGATALANGRLEIGMYLLSSGERLPVSDDQRQRGGDALELPK